MSISRFYKGGYPNYRAQVSIEMMMILFVIGMTVAAAGLYLSTYKPENIGLNQVTAEAEKFQNIAIERVEIDKSGNYAIVVKNNGNDVLIKTVSVETPYQEIESEDTMPTNMVERGIFLKKGQRYVFKNLNVESPGLNKKVKAEITIEYVDFKDGIKQGEHLSTYRKFEVKVRDKIEVSGSSYDFIDSDNDGIVDKLDNDDNDNGLLDSQETDANGNGYSDEYDPEIDSDSDGIPNSEDSDLDNDGVPNIIDDDDDGDGVPDIIDPNHDSDGDLIPDKSDTDDDDDGISDINDDDDDGDSIVDLCDPDADPDYDGIPNSIDYDDDNDGIYDISDTDHVYANTSLDCRDYLPINDDDKDGDMIPDVDDPDYDPDGDGIPNAIDPDDDGDGVPDSVDTDMDRDNDGVPDIHDNDDDNDGIPDTIDVDDDGDGIYDVIDPDHDIDGDGIADVNDDDDDNDGFVDDNDVDDDGDGIVDTVDPDQDTDGDGIPNAVDNDDDGDGIVDTVDPDQDTDGDGIADVNDDDDDNDGIPDGEDLDADGDGIDDSGDPDRTDVSVSLQDDNDDIDDDSLSFDIDTVCLEGETCDIDDNGENDLEVSFREGRLSRFYVACEWNNNPAQRANWRSHWKAARVRWNPATKSIQQTDNGILLSVRGVARRSHCRTDVSLKALKHKDSECVEFSVYLTPRKLRIDPSMLLFGFSFRTLNLSDYSWVDGVVISGDEHKGFAFLATRVSEEAPQYSMPLEVRRGHLKLMLTDISSTYRIVALVVRKHQEQQIPYIFVVARTDREITLGETYLMRFNLCRLSEEVSPTPDPTPTSEPTPPSVPKHTLTGDVRLCNTSLSFHEETVTVRKNVDIVYVIDVSGSMAWGWSSYWSSPKKIVSAKNVLKSFTDKLESGDKAALVSFGHKIQDNPGRWGARVDVQLTSDFDYLKSKISQLSANGATPLASGIKLARELLQEIPYDEERVKVMLVATDGVANVKLNGRLVGGSLPAQQAIQEAQTAADNGIIIYSIGIGNDVNQDTLKAIAGTDERYYHAVSDGELQEIYNSIADEIGEVYISCSSTQSEVSASDGISILLTGDSYSAEVLTDETGHYSFTGVPEGIYTVSVEPFVYEGVVFDILSSTLCGDSETLTVTLDSDKTLDLYMKSSNPPKCPEDIVITVTPTPTPAPAPEIDSCDDFCKDALGYSYGHCRKDASKCYSHGEDYQWEGNTYCNAPKKKCCCG